ncbi:MAG: ATP-dependent DNA helicase [Patescibacteria group bacterium]|jgi:DNA helicase-2/ATP-dependent DNA helicase PcrA
MPANPLLEDLNPEQLMAVTHGEGPLMIIAGAGTGKTTVVTKRIAWLIEQKLAEPNEILALTFTDKAANEMEERVDRLLPMGYLDLSISTFHSFCEKVLREHGIHIGIPSDFKLYTEVDCWLLMRRNIDRFELDYFKPRGSPTKFLRQLLQHFSRAKDEGITPEKYLLAVEELESVILSDVVISSGARDLIGQSNPSSRRDDNAVSDEDRLELQKWQELSSAYAMYETLLSEKHAIDFGGLLLLTLELFKTRPNVLEEYKKRFKYIIVDEFQDTNSIQNELVKILVHEPRNITVVGDDDQAIYKFRGAALANILEFRTDFPDASRVVLTRNYRSGATILDAAHKLIQTNNPHRLEASEGLSKKLQSQTESEGLVRHLHCATAVEEVEQVIKEIITKHESGEAEWSDFAILARSNDAVDPFLEALERAGVPYHFVALSGLYTKPIILDAMAYMRAVCEPYHSPAMYRILSHPRLGLTEGDLSELMRYVRRKSGGAIIDGMRSLTQAIGMSLDGRNRAMQITTIIEQLREKAKRLPVTELFVSVLKDTGLLGDLKVLAERDQQENFRHLEGFLARLKRYVIASPDNKLLPGFLEEFDAEREAGEAGGLRPDAEEGPDVVNVMTIHAAKGLEFKYVFVVNMIEQRFPSVSRSDQLPLPPALVRKVDAALDDHVAEERRLFYVAMTRAKEGLYLCSAEDYGGTRKRKPSRFLAELGYQAPVVEKKKTITTDDLLDERAGGRDEDRAIPSLALPTKFSFSQIAAFGNCPLQYKYAHILKIPTFGRHQFSFGQSMHLTLEKFVKRLLEAEGNTQVSLFGAPPTAPVLPSERELLEMYSASFIDEWYPDSATREKYREEGVKALKEFHRKVAENTPKPLLLEAGFTLKIGDILMKGRIDRIDSVDGGVEIIDYKTGRAKEKLEWDDRRQLLLYALAGEQCFNPPLIVKALTYYYVETNQTMSFAPTEKDKEKLLDEIQETVGGIRTSSFEAKPGPFTCKYCDFKDICPKAEL